MRSNTKKFIDLECAWCKKQFSKELKEYTRQSKDRKKNFFCSLKCLEEFRNDPLLAFNCILSRIRHNSKLKDRTMDLTAKDIHQLWLDQDGICPYTGFRMQLPAKEKQCSTPITASLDRIDSSRGYEKGNVELVCLSVNFAKNRFSKEQIYHFFHSVSCPEKLDYALFESRVRQTSLVTLICEYCGESFLRYAKEHTRNQKKGRGNFCSLQHFRSFANKIQPRIRGKIAPK